jgi:hypothetical protein
MKRIILPILGGVALVIVLVGAAFVGGQLMRAQQQQAQSAATEPRKLVTRAPEVPMQPPDARGDLVRRTDNSLIICDPRHEPSINADGTVTENGTCAPEIEVIIGHDTNMLHDVSALRNPTISKDVQGDVVIQQYIEPGSAADIVENTAVRVWGERRGERVIARTLLYWNRSPVTIRP